MPARLATSALVMLAAASPAAALTRKHTRGGVALARAALLQRSDLGRGWTRQAEPPRRVPPLTCPRFSPRLPGVLELGSAASATFGRSAEGPFESQTAYVYSSDAQAARTWRAVVVPRLLRCIAASLTHSSGGGVSFRVTRRQRLPMPRPTGARGARYRVRGVATGAGQTMDVFLDVMLVGRGRAISEVSLSSFDRPPTRRLDLRLARAAARRVSSP